MIHDNRKQVVVIVCHIRLNALELFASVLQFLLFLSLIIGILFRSMIRYEGHSKDEFNLSKIN